MGTTQRAERARQAGRVPADDSWTAKLLVYIGAACAESLPLLEGNQRACSGLLPSPWKTLKQLAGKCRHRVIVEGRAADMSIRATRALPYP